jgi:hypothetical protein
MRQLAALVALASLALTGTVRAASGFGTAAIVIAVDAKAKTIKFKHSDEGTWKETVATWDDKTEWKRADKEIWDEKPASATLATELKKDSKIYVTVYDRGGTTFFIETLKTVPASFEIN